MSDAAFEAVVQILATRFGFEVRQQESRSDQLRLLGKVPDNQTRNWVIFRQYMLERELQSEWSYDCSRKDLLRGGALVWGWRLIFQHADLASQVPSIVASIENCPRAKFEVEEQSLPGVTGQRTMMTAKGKGASSAGSAPLIIRQRMGG